MVKHAPVDFCGTVCHLECMKWYNLPLWVLG
jgi:hypothetical protein